MPSITLRKQCPNVVYVQCLLIVISSLLLRLLEVSALDDTYAARAGLSSSVSALRYLMLEIIFLAREAQLKDSLFFTVFSIFFSVFPMFPFFLPNRFLISLIHYFSFSYTALLPVCMYSHGLQVHQSHQRLHNETCIILLFNC